MAEQIAHVPFPKFIEHHFLESYRDNVVYFDNKYYSRQGKTWTVLSVPVNRIERRHLALSDKNILIYGHDWYIMATS
jgi:hypothetical protein